MTITKKTYFPPEFTSIHTQNDEMLTTSGVYEYGEAKETCPELDIYNDEIWTE